MAGFNNALELGSIARGKEVSKLKKLMGEIKPFYPSLSRGTIR
jgi:hypothetical protein